MENSDAIALAMAERLFAEIATPSALARFEAGEWLAAEWREIENVGLPLALIPEEAGGIGIDPLEALGIVRLAGRFCLPLPLAETMVANRLLALSGLPLAEGPATFAPGRKESNLRIRRQGAGWHLAGESTQIPWGRCAKTIVVLADGEEGLCVASVPGDGLAARDATNIAKEPRDGFDFDMELPADAVAAAPAGIDLSNLRLLGAILRSVSMAGALDRVLEMTVTYAGDRIQFGRPIGRFQAVQQNLAVMAGHVAAASAAADLASEAIDSLDLLPVAAAKVRIGEAAGAVAAIAHQVHGALGFTQEYGLHFLTKRLWAWRDEFGNEAEWSRAIGEQVLERGADGLWPLVTAV